MIDKFLSVANKSIEHDVLHFYKVYLAHRKVSQAMIIIYQNGEHINFI